MKLTNNNSYKHTIELKQTLVWLNKLKQRDNNVLLYSIRNSLNTRYRSRDVNERGVYKSRFRENIATFRAVRISKEINFIADKGDLINSFVVIENISHHRHYWNLRQNSPPPIFVSLIARSIRHFYF